MDEDIAIRIQNLGKRYSIGKKSAELRESIFNFGRNKENGEFWALDNITFDIKKNDVLGIVGKNGAGKSTLLKVLSQITSPTKGKIEIFGRVASLLEVGTGFHPELTGRENIFLNGTILGMSRKEIAAKFEEIVEFSGVEKFIDTPVKHYSSGMYVRLAFSVAAHLDPEILIIDEVLAVGDIEFQKKCIGKMHDISNVGKTVVFVSHNTAVLSNICNKGILLVDGKINGSGKINEVLEKYLSSTKNQDTKLAFFPRKNRELGNEILITGINGWSDHQIELQDTLQETFSGSTYRIRISYSSKINLSNVTFSIGFFSQDGSIFYTSLRSDCIKEFVDIKNENGSVIFEVDNMPFAGGVYSINLMISKGASTFDWIENASHLTVASGDFYQSGILPASGRQGVLFNFRFSSE